MPPKTTGPLATEPEDHEATATPEAPPAALADEQAMPPGAEPQTDPVNDSGDTPLPAPDAEPLPTGLVVDVGSDSAASDEGEESEQPKRTRKRENVGQYVVLYAELDEPNDFAVVLDDDSKPKMYGGKQEDAKRSAVAEDATLREKAKTDGVLVVAVPAGSWRPTTAKAEVKVTFS